MKKMLQIFRNPWFIFGLIVFGAVSTRVVFEGVEAWDKGVIALQNGDDEEAIFQFRTAGRWTLPGFSVPKQALSKLMSLGDEALKECQKCPVLPPCTPAKRCQSGRRIASPTPTLTHARTPRAQYPKR